MNPNDYIKNALVTEARNEMMKGDIKTRLQNEGTIRLLHAFLGLETETAELQDVLKKHLFYGKPIDRVNLKEEAGDILWYLAVLFDELEVSFEEVMETNINKLKARYGEKFTERAALERNLEKEYEVLKK